MSRQNIAGYLFLCTNRTQNECLENKLFGAVRQYFGWIKQITKGTPLFLYNVDTKTLFGPFIAADQGGWNISPRAWENVRPLEFPAQVLVGHEIIHKLTEAHKKLKFLKRTSICRLNEEQTNALLKALEMSVENL